MTKKPTGLAAFTGKAPASTVSQVALSSRSERKRGKGDIIAITVRLNRKQWERLHQLALADGESLQGLAIKGFSAILRDKGLPEL